MLLVGRRSTDLTAGLASAGRGRTAHQERHVATQHAHTQGCCLKQHCNSSDVVAGSAQVQKGVRNLICKGSPLGAGCWPLAPWQFRVSGGAPTDRHTAAGLGTQEHRLPCGGPVAPMAPADVHITDRGPRGARITTTPMPRAGPHPPHST